MFDLSRKIAFITGAATGLGQCIAVALARAGADVVISDKGTESLDETEKCLQPTGRRVLRIAVDVRDLDQIKKGIALAEESFGRIDILVNNAGINRPLPGLEVTLDNWEDHFKTNVRGGFFLTQAVAPGMVARRWGRIIFISSQSGLIGIPGQPVYCATKGAVIQLVRTLGVEWARYGITVNSIAPTFVETNLTRTRLRDPEFRKFVLQKIPRGELAAPEHVASGAVYLASDEAAMVNCETHCVDGGWTAW
ncbi:MAG TPA: SDR family oxidoreductase [Verrucomicrobiae bacterium]|jgi:2-deoxy-D-gluconate 3-dehydrogenase|nr:SDR family oxidoreductase [Verrucomicrobiae bacterium]